MNVGDTLGSFTITARLGAGGMGEVFLGEQQSIDTKVAIKVLRREISKDQEHVKRFFNEARAVGKIKHAGTVKIYEGGFHPSGHAYLIMEFLEGESLAARIQRMGRLGLASVGDLGRQIASVLSATHAVGITHRDLKPDNIFIVADAELASGERVKILDFGIAKLTGATLAGAPQTFGTMGTPAYMAPEQWGNSASVDWRADAYSLGCVLFEMVCGRPPFVGASFADLCAKHLSAAPPTPASLGAAIPTALEQLIMRLLVKDADQRTTPLADIIRELEAIGRAAPPAALAATLPPPASAEVVPPTLVTGASATPLPSPARSEPPPPQSDPPTTTLRGAAGESLPPRRRRGGVLAAVGTIGVVGAVAITVKVRSSGSEVPQPPPPAPADAAELAVIVDAQPSLRERIEARNPFVTVRTFMNQTRQVQSRVTTNEELAMYLASLPEDVRAKSGPLAEVADPSPNGAAVGMTYERARAFCLAIGADLPATEIWKRSPNHENWQEWTATVQDGLVTVMGTHPQMTPVERTQALAEPLLKATEASAGPGAAAAVIADKHITFRCAR